MAQFRAYAPTAEVLGAAVLAIVGGVEFARQRALRILGDHGIGPLEADRWYPQQRVLDAFRTIALTIGPATVRAIGEKIPESAPFPPGIDGLENALLQLDVAYRMNHRGEGNLGGYRMELTGQREGHMVCDNPYPCEMDEGLIHGLARRFRPADSLRLLVEHLPGECRHHGADRCRYAVKW